MIDFYFDKKSYELLNQWAAEHRWQTVNALPYDRRMNVHLNGFDVYFSAYSKGGYKFAVKDSAQRVQVAKGSIFEDETKQSDFGIRFSLTNTAAPTTEELQSVQHLVQMFATAVLNANAFLWYGNLDDERKIAAVGSNTSAGKSIIFREHQGELYAIPTGTHRSPQGIFNVRGHFRFYKKTGKVIWIDSYFKGF